MIHLSCKSSGSFSASSLETGVSSKLYVGRVTSKQDGRRSLMVMMMMMTMMVMIIIFITMMMNMVMIFTIMITIMMMMMVWGRCVKDDETLCTWNGQLRCCPVLESPISPGNDDDDDISSIIIIIIIIINLDHIVIINLDHIVLRRLNSEIRWRSWQGNEASLNVVADVYFL